MGFMEFLGIWGRGLRAMGFQGHGRGRGEGLGEAWEAMLASTHKTAPNKAKMVDFLEGSSTVNSADVAGCLRWGTGELKLNCVRKQLPMATKVLDWAVRPSAQ